MFCDQETASKLQVALDKLRLSVRRLEELAEDREPLADQVDLDTLRDGIRRREARDGAADHLAAVADQLTSALDQDYLTLEGTWYLSAHTFADNLRQAVRAYRLAAGQDKE